MIESKELPAGIKQPWNRIIAIDPGPAMSAYALFVDGVLQRHERVSNDRLRALMEVADLRHETGVVIEGMRVPHADVHTFMTCYEIGRVLQICEARGNNPVMVYRFEVKKHWLGTVQGGDKQIRDALVEHYGGYVKVDTKPGAKNPYKLVPPPALEKVTADCWSAVAIGLYAYRKHCT